MNEAVVNEAEVAESKRPRKLIKATSKENMTVTIEVVGVDNDPVEYSLSELNEDIIDSLALHGLSQKLGDSAAGKEGAEALSSISETWDNLKDGKFKGERASGERMPSKKSILATLEGLSPDDQEATKAVLAKLGLTF